MVQKLINGLLYAGVDYDSFELVHAKIRKTNQTMTIILSSFASVLILAMFVSSFGINSIGQNRVVYEHGFFASIAILVLSLTITRKFEKLTMPLVYLSCALYYIYGIMIGTITDPTGKTVTFMVMLVFLPILFIDRPIHSILRTFFYAAIFIILCGLYKEPDVRSVDIIDAVVFSLLGVTSGCVVSRMRIKGYISEKMLHAVSRTDQLTKMNNQNAFQLDMYTFYSSFKKSLTCIYIDVNGLHKLNNERGHSEGDKMLQYVASQIIEYFGKETAYRTGGDEFIVFIPDVNREIVAKKISDFNGAIEKMGYSVAIGYEIISSHHFTIEELVHNADLRMQEAKNLYHAQHDR